MLGAIPLGFITSSSGFNPTTVEQSAWFDGVADYLSWTPGAAASAVKGTYHVFLQRTGFGTDDGVFATYGTIDGATKELFFTFQENNTLDIYWWQGSTQFRLVTNRVFRDIKPYHIIFSYDTSQAVASDRCKLWVNGEQETSFSTATYPSLNYAPPRPFTSVPFGIGLSAETGSLNSDFFNGHMAQVAFFDGQSIQSGDLAITDLGEWWPFGENGEEWAPLADADIEARANAAGGNSFALTSEIGDGTDASSNSNNFTPTSMSHALNGSDNTPSNVYAIWNELDPTDNIHSKGNQRVDGVGADFDSSRATLFVSTGKYYFEFERDVDSGGSDRYRVGVSNATFPLSTTPDGRADFWGFSENGNKIGGGAANAAYGSTHTTGAYVGVALDLDNGAIWFSVDGAWQAGATISEIEAGTTANAAFTNVSGEVTPTANLYSTEACTLRTTESSWEGTPPAGFVALCTANLPTPEHQGCDYFNTLLYTGTGAALSVTGNGFQPDFNWIKNRAAADSHVLTDVIRGVGEILSSDTTAAEATDADTVTAFGSDGFSLGADVKVNTNTENYVSWNWKAGGAAVANTDGTIASQVSVSPAGHFGIVGYTGTGANATVGHGLPVAPEMLITKNRIDVSSWPVWHIGMTGGTYAIDFNNSNTQANNSTKYNGSPTATVFNVGTNGETNGSGDAMITLAFRSVPGLCKVGKYTGNGLADGPYVHLGFRARWLLIKRIDSTGDWTILDTARDPGNPVQKGLEPNSSNSESTVGNFPFDFNGDSIKCRDNNAQVNASGGNYTYVAIADIAGGGDLPPIPGR